MKKKRIKAQDAVDACWNRIGVWGDESPRCPELERVIHCHNCEVFAAAGRRLLDRNPPAGYRGEWSKELAQVGEVQERETESVVIFRVGNEWLALATHVFKEVVGIRPIHTVPHRKAGVLRGVVNIRGELQLCISLGKLMGIEPGEVRTASAAKSIYDRIAVVSFKETRYAFPVSEIRGVHRYAQTDLLDGPVTAIHCAQNYLHGMLNWHDRHVGCLNEELLFSAVARVLK